MARLSIPSTFYIFLLLLISTISASKKELSCPTIIKTTSRPSCPSPTPSICPTPDCILEEFIDVPCGCPSTVPTSYYYTPCPTACHGECGTAYSTQYDASCASTISSSISTLSITTITVPPPTTTFKSDTCVTITQTTGIGCPENTCPVAECELESTITLECGCPSIFTATSCKTKCDGACMTDYDTLYLPCPFSLPSPTTTSTVVAPSVPTYG